MKQSGRRELEECVKISVTVAQSEDFRQYLAISKDSYVMGLGRIAALCLDILMSKKRVYSAFELDRVVSWPAERSLSFGRVLEMVGWASYRSASLLELEMPGHFIPRRPYRERSAFQAVKPPRDGEGRFLSSEAMESRILTRHGRRIILVDMDGYPRDGLESIDNPKEKPDYKRRARHGRGPIVPDK